MRLANGIVVDKEKTFGLLKFSALRREVRIQNDIVNIGLHFFSRMFDLMLPPVAKHSIVVA